MKPHLIAKLHVCWSCLSLNTNFIKQKMKSTIKIALALLLATQIQAQNLKVMTNNIRLDVSSDGENDWSHRKDYLTAQIHFYEPDILGIQEAKPNQVLDVATALKEYKYIGIGREENNTGESSNIFYKKERLKLLKESTFWLSKTPDIVSRGWDAACNRVCTYALFQDNITGHYFWVFNTHLDHIGQEARINGIQLILAKIKELNVKKYPVMLMGDLNAEPTDVVITTLKKELNDSRLISEQAPFGPSGTFNNFEHNKPVTLLLDYIFISKDNKYTVNKYAVLSDSKDLRYPSDHLPVYIEISTK